MASVVLCCGCEPCRKDDQIVLANLLEFKVLHVSPQVDIAVGESGHDSVKMQTSGAVEEGEVPP